MAVDLVDETLREGSERASIAVSIEDKCDLACAIASIGLRSLVVGMFPDVPHNIELLQRLLQAQRRGELPPTVRFLVISHVGQTFRATLRALERIGEPLDNVWVVAIHGASDLQIRYLFPKILLKDPSLHWDAEAWSAASVEERRRRNLEWLDGFLPEVVAYRGGGVMMGLLDAFRADHGHLCAAAALVARHGIRQIRLVDTAGSCTPSQVPQWIDPLVAAHPEVGFYCHFHDDFGLASANALLALGCGARGVDVAVGGFANRAGHPALAEVVAALRVLQGVELPGFDYAALPALSRRVERIYGLLERANQPITGVITHAVQAGIRTELVGEARRIFDEIDPEMFGATLRRSFGVRSGLDGLERLLKPHSTQLAEEGIVLTPQLVQKIYSQVIEKWHTRSDEIRRDLNETIGRYHKLLEGADFTEAEVVEQAFAIARARDAAQS